MTTAVVKVGRPKLDLDGRRCAFAECGAVLERKPGEYPSDWRRRKFCDQRCSHRQQFRGDRPVEVSPAGWETRGACSARPSELWWTDTSSDTAEVERLRVLALEFCAVCPVRQFCRQQGRRERFGLFGGVLWRSVSGKREPLNLLAPVAASTGAA